MGGSGFVANDIASLVGPIFECNRNKRRVKIEEYCTIQIGFQYEQAVLNAFSEVDNSLAQYRTYNEENAIRKTQIIAAPKALELTRAKYDFGYSSFYEVLIQENYLFEAELEESFTFQENQLNHWLLQSIRWGLVIIQNYILIN